MLFHPKNLKSENNNLWFKPWFNVLLHTQSIVCATVDSQCLEYLGYITLHACKKCVFLYKVTYIKVQTIYLTRLIPNIMSLKCVDKITDLLVRWIIKLDWNSLDISCENGKKSMCSHLKYEIISRQFDFLFRKLF